MTEHESLRTAGDAINREAERQMLATVIAAADAAVAEWNSPHTGRTERDEAMTPRMAELSAALTILDAHRASQATSNEAAVAEAIVRARGSDLPDRLRARHESEKALYEALKEGDTPTQEAR